MQPATKLCEHSRFCRNFGIKKINNRGAYIDNLTFDK